MAKGVLNRKYITEFKKQVVETMREKELGYREVSLSRPNGQKNQRKNGMILRQRRQ